MANTLQGRCLTNPHADGAPPVGVRAGLLAARHCEELRQLEDRILQEILADPKRASPDESAYTGGPGVAFFLVKAAAMRGEPDLLGAAAQLLEPWRAEAEASAGRDPALGCSLLCGLAGWLCVEALRRHTAGDAAGARETVAAYTAMAGTAASNAQDADEWLYGRAGYLHGCLLLQHICGRDAVPQRVVADVAEAILAGGEAYARQSGCGSPLMWRWYGEEYLGAAHGVMGIIFVLLHVEAVVQDARAQRLLVDTMRWIVEQKRPSGNWPAVRGGRDDHLVHFCHGAPGAVHLFCKAYEVLGDPLYLREAQAAGELVWRYGMLRKGPSLCHGFAGNGYVFLALFRAGGGERWLRRACHYGAVMLQPDVVRQCRTPDNPLSLFEGTAGAGCFLLDLRLAPATSALPLFEVGWLSAVQPAGVAGALVSDAEAALVLQKNAARPLSASESETASDGAEVALDEGSDSDVAEVEDSLSRAFSRTMGSDEPVDRRQNILRRHMNSMLISAFDFEVRAELESLRGESPTVASKLWTGFKARTFFDHPTLAGMARCLVGRCACLMCQGGRSAEGGPPSVTARPSSPPRAVPSARLRISTQFGLTGGHDGQAQPVYRKTDVARFLRGADGMTCVVIPGATATIGDGGGGRVALANEGPAHKVALSRFLMDVEPVTVAAYARFLNAVKPPEEAISLFLNPDFAQRASLGPFAPLARAEAGGDWALEPGANASWPMFNVTWYGANAYSLWANGEDWAGFRDARAGFLPTEAQWEYAARGAVSASFPWGDGLPSPALLNARFGAPPPGPGEASLASLGLCEVGYELGVSPFGLRHMAGNVWQWCRDAYDHGFYRQQAASEPDAWNSAEGGPRAERGGSWVGDASVARSSYRRGRDPLAKGLCLGFRCVGRYPVPTET